MQRVALLHRDAIKGLTATLVGIGLAWICALSWDLKHSMPTPLAAESQLWIFRVLVFAGVGFVTSFLGGRNGLKATTTLASLIGLVVLWQTGEQMHDLPSSAQRKEWLMLGSMIVFLMTGAAVQTLTKRVFSRLGVRFGLPSERD